MITPLPAHKPLALTTMGAPVFVMYSFAASAEVVRMYVAVGTCGCRVRVQYDV